VKTHVMCADRWIVNIEVRVIVGEALWVCLCMCPFGVEVLIMILGGGGGGGGQCVPFSNCAECQSDENRCM
jgi:hypothetical protein